ncbi:MAG: hypothetical protein ACTS6A_01545, partial [Candidatus Hodgkinia cicadicola]
WIRYSGPRRSVKVYIYHARQAKLFCPPKWFQHWKFSFHFVTVTLWPPSRHCTFWLRLNF